MYTIRVHINNTYNTIQSLYIVQNNCHTDQKTKSC